MQHVLSTISEDLRDRLTGKELGEVMSIRNASYHEGKASAGAEIIDGDYVWAAGQGWPLAILRNLTITTKPVVTWVPTDNSSTRGGDNDKYVCRNGKYIRLDYWQAQGTNEQLY